MRALNIPMGMNFYYLQFKCRRFLVLVLSWWHHSSSVLNERSTKNKILPKKWQCWCQIKRIKIPRFFRPFLLHTFYYLPSPHYNHQTLFLSGFDFWSETIIWDLACAYCSECQYVQHSIEKVTIWISSGAIVSNNMRWWHSFVHKCEHIA